MKQSQMQLFDNKYKPKPPQNAPRTDHLHDPAKKTPPLPCYSLKTNR